jgi:hypothetical protein
MTAEDRRRLELGLRVLGACCSRTPPSTEDVTELADRRLPLDEMARKLVQVAVQRCRLAELNT